MYSRSYYNRPSPYPEYWSYDYSNYPPAAPQEMNYPQAPIGGQSANMTPYDYFQKPEQPMNWPNNVPFEQNQFSQQPQTPPNVMSHFQKENGQLDLDKVLGTVGQLASTYHQVAPIVQQFGSFMKNFRAGS
ncbi:YppG family protein [Oceanobacillus halophilus]|nr:YppG family protein [Oceanobacillus halophilus]